MTGRYASTATSHDTLPRPSPLRLHTTQAKERKDAEAKRVRP
eukprot:CAMPEP_0175967408 /NCGR_PEP_ID=MMETSP0108-20121206/39281_1 /TAXON_ID=195067 ORGANISM="Goniomonas pacifica, Strain CCMP1869" /NCGR_SAMPLE_ID=MMETSP0108 /ASSEMBLY_ACC=CAM_ASM_000204 /LENGTH=41 /DNA_ID= /DNA_START= /DNA_END= /DNA_ORIENTATION=